MADREAQDRGGPGEQSSGGISRVIGDIERKAAGRDSEGATLQVVHGLQYPLARDDLVREAAGNGAPGQLLDLLTRLPDRVYVSAEDVVGELQRTR